MEWGGGGVELRWRGRVGLEALKGVEGCNGGGVRVEG